MTGRTTIEWTDQPGYVGAVWNPTTGCTRVSAGCDNCYAFALHDKRYKANLDASHGADDGREGTPTQRARRAGAKLPWPKQYDLPFSRVQLLEDRLDAPLRKRKPTCYFVDSMADLFHEDVDDTFLDRVFFTMLFATWHRFLILTKRPDRMRRYIDSRPNGPEVPKEYVLARFKHIDGVDLGKSLAGVPAYVWPAPNVWLGTSVEDQRSADERIPHLLATPAAVRFLSCEPLLGPVIVGDALGWRSARGVMAMAADLDDVRANNLRDAGLHWLIVGGESGPRARPMDLAWARSLRDQCAAAGVSFFMKQLGSKPIEERIAAGFGPLPPALDVREAHGRDMDEWPDDLRVRTWPR